MRFEYLMSAIRRKDTKGMVHNTSWPAAIKKLLFSNDRLEPKEEPFKKKTI